MSEEEINVQLSTAYPVNNPYRPRSDLRRSSGLAILVFQNPLSSIAFDAREIFIVGLRQQLVYGCTQIIGDAKCFLEITYTSPDEIRLDAAPAAVLSGESTTIVATHYPDKC